MVIAIMDGDTGREWPSPVSPWRRIRKWCAGGADHHQTFWRNAQDLEKTVAQPIEEQLVGLDGILYYLSSSGNDGSLSIQVTFKLGTNPDIATVQTQNRVSIAMPRLPPEVQQQGVTVKKVSSAFLLAISLVSKDNRTIRCSSPTMRRSTVEPDRNLEGVGESRSARTRFTPCASGEPG